MMTLRKTWCTYEIAFIITADVETINQINENLYRYETQYLCGWLDYDSYIEHIRKYLTAMNVAYEEIYEEV